MKTFEVHIKYTDSDTLEKYLVSAESYDKLMENTLRYISIGWYRMETDSGALLVNSRGIMAISIFRVATEDRKSDYKKGPHVKKR